MEELHERIRKKTGLILINPHLGLNHRGFSEVQEKYPQTLKRPLTGSPKHTRTNFSGVQKAILNDFWGFAIRRFHGF
jgi:hypothetical protein